ncbi:hypothetical protein DRJ25_01530 [Candidatus Woesearchaeota archaeon]|nr:MAG: hypothetical protein DRJ25_01530 [Candidatus Woesearchaeota archaeon]
MEINITEEKNNEFLKRKELKGTITFTAATPSKTEVTKKLSEMTKTDEKLTLVKHIHTQFGSQKAKFIAYIYENEEMKNKIEPKKKEKKKQGAQ